MKLIVLAGAKQGAEIPLKKDKFVIGRASDCTLRGGSDAISRHHCLLLRRDQKVSVRDLGSRNGTYVNDQRIEAETPLTDGDELRIGPLKFRFDIEKTAKHAKQPKVKNVADALARTAAQPEDPASEDDISRWLLGPDPGSKAMVETQTFRLDETRAGGGSPESSATADTDASDESQSDLSSDGQAADPNHAKTKKPGKLPPIPQKPKSKDSREAASDVLREMARRR